MARIIRVPGRFLFATAVLGSLAFGATQALATPHAPTAESRACSDAWCADWCGGLGYCHGMTCACY